MSKKDKDVWKIYVKPNYKKSNRKVFEVSNYKSIKKIKLKIDNLTILVGENASGKSNILDYFSFYSLNFFDLKDLIKKMSDEFGGHAWGALDGYRSGGDQIKIIPLGLNNTNISMSLNEERKTFFYETQFMDTKELPLEKTMETNKYLENGKTVYDAARDYFLTSIPTGFNSSAVKNINVIEDTLPYFSIKFNITNMNNNNVEKNISNELINLIDIGFNIKENQNDIFDLLSFLPEIKGNVNNVLYNFIELKKKDNLSNNDKKITIDLSLKYDINKMNKINVDGFQILICDEAENRIFPPNMKSSGINSIITMVTTVEFLKYLIKNHSDRSYKELNYLFTIDEPELYLHPKIQKNLVSYLYQSANEINEIKFLIATHSPYLIHPNAINSTYIIDYDINNGSVANKLVDIINNQEEKYSILSPIEDSLGLSFNEFLHPIVFVEGKEEFDIFKRISNIYESVQIIHNIKGKSKFPSIALLMDKFKNQNETFYIFLDADFSFKDDFKYVDNGERLLNNLSEHIFFIGKNIYRYEEYTNLESKGECLEDFIIYKIFEDTEYELLINIVTEIHNKYFNISFSMPEPIDNFLQVIERFRGFIRNNKKSGTSFIKDRIIKVDSIKNKTFKDVERIIEIEIKEEIKNKLLSQEEKFKEFEELILEKLSN